MLKLHENDPYPELQKFVAGSGINHSGSTTLVLDIARGECKLPGFGIKNRTVL